METDIGYAITWAPDDQHIDMLQVFFTGTGLKLGLWPDATLNIEFADRKQLYALADTFRAIADRLCHGEQHGPTHGNQARPLVTFIDGSVGSLPDGFSMRDSDHDGDGQ